MSLNPFYYGYYPRHNVPYYHHHSYPWDEYDDDDDNEWSSYDDPDMMMSPYEDPRGYWDLDPTQSSLTTGSSSETMSDSGGDNMMRMRGGYQPRRKYTLNIPMSQMIRPEDVKVSLKDHEMTIEAKSSYSDKKSRWYGEMTKKFTLPDSVQPKNVKSFLTPDGFLKIQAPLQVDREAAIEIPINFESNQDSRFSKSFVNTCNIV